MCLLETRHAHLLDTILKIKVPKDAFHTDAVEEPFQWSVLKRTTLVMLFNENNPYNWSTLYSQTQISYLHATGHMRTTLTKQEHDR